MRHVICQNFVEEQLANARKKKPGLKVWLALAFWIAIVMFFIFVISIILYVVLSTSGHLISKFPSDVRSVATVFLTCFLIFILFDVIWVLIVGGRAGQISLKKIIAEFRGGEEAAILEAGLAGEQAVARELQSLDDHWVLCSGVVLEGTMGDIDHVLIGPPGVYAIEVKNWSGKIEYSDDTSTWTRYKPRLPQGEVLKDPAEQVVQLSGVLGNTLKEKSVPVVVFVNPNSTVSGSDHPRATILTLSQLKKWVTSQPARLSTEKVDALSSKLTAAFKKVPDQTPVDAKTKVSAPAVPSKVSVQAPVAATARPSRSCRTPLAMLIILALAGIASILLGVQYTGITQPSGCTKAVTTYIRSGPSLNDELLGTAPKGTCFNFDGRSKDGYWIRITGLNGFRGGWTTINYIEIKPEVISNLPLGD